MRTGLKAHQRHQMVSRAIGTAGSNVCDMEASQRMLDEHAELSHEDPSPTVQVSAEMLEKWQRGLNLAQQQTYPMYQRQMVQSVIDQIAATVDQTASS